MDWEIFVVILATAVVTNLVGAGSIWLNHRFQLERQREADAAIAEREERARQTEEEAAQRQERREFQKSTLLRLQEVLIGLAWSSVRPSSLDAATYGYGSRSFDDVVGEGWSSKLATLAGEVEMLRVRLSHPELRTRLEDIRQEAIFALDVAEDRTEGGEALMSLNAKCLETLERVGDFLAMEWTP